MYRGIRVVLYVLTVLLTCLHPVSAQVQFDWAIVGNSGNAPDPATGFGAVDYDYRISKFEVTNAQYVEFLNAKAASDPTQLYTTAMGTDWGGITRSGVSGSYTYSLIPGRENSPVSYISWFDAIRFVNWLHNGQGNGDTETGAYTLSEATDAPSNGPTVVRNPEATYFLPTEDEWYKAAYHNAASGTAGDYFLYANSSNIMPVSDQPEDNAGAANYFNDDGLANDFNDGYVGNSSTNSLNRPTSPFTNVGAYTDAISPYGTFDQNGNIWEWNESLIANLPHQRGLRGGSWSSGTHGDDNLSALYRGRNDPLDVPSDLGFRVGTVIPEPTSITLLATVACFVLRRRL